MSAARKYTPRPPSPHSPEMEAMRRALRHALFCSVPVGTDCMQCTEASRLLEAKP